jgi:RHS repeat-associated protein
MIEGKLIRQMYVYDAWGNHQIKTDVNGIGTVNPIRYRGYYFDTETGFYFLKTRYYDPEICEVLHEKIVYSYCNCDIS